MKWTLVSFFLISGLTCYANSTSQETPKHKPSLHDQFTGQGYGMAGCGLGSVIFGENDERGIQILAVTTNGFYSTNSFAITSGTSNCVKNTSSSAQAVRKNTELYVTANKKALETDAARGDGETIAALGEIIGCSSTESLAVALQKNYGQVFKTEKTSSVEITDGVFNMVKKHPLLSKTCQI